jgi:hypothetical protein
MQIDLDENDDAYSAPPLPSGGLATGGGFGEDALSKPATATQYLQKINPNLVITGVFALGGLFALSMLIAALGKANPNSQMLQAQQVTAQANGTALTATTDALKTVANQRPSCIAIVCNFPDAKPAQEVQQPVEQYPDYYQQPPQTIAATVPTDPRQPDYWRFWLQQDHNYVDRYVAYCRSQGGYGIGLQTPACQALSQTLAQTLY